ncbi:acyl dehydratase [Sphingomonas sp. SORGH_AS802]|uniref:MaoC family dehydratase n=1 Tax=unclassified Sphingomonas TaxID=196159 RepID=UPI0028663D6C|nr:MULTISPECIES: MaoC family dehydratase [unclassified Sphingomonas]MDR6125554.1 acyl dehydratase [Sphingomonas sp. SORGH_AS_0438]MDR6134169.1 acyl dehydratase [Sphingomonas sp. SORGH_AS_0802]
MRYFEDLVVGGRARFGDYAVTREEVLDFARRYDPQPFHLDDDAAAATHFGRLAASGWHTAAMTMAMLVAQMGRTAEASLGSPGLDELKWLRPVYPGDRLRVETELLEKRLSASRPGLGLTKSRTTTFNQDGVAVMTFVANGMIRTRPSDG